MDEIGLIYNKHVYIDTHHILQMFSDARFLVGYFGVYLLWTWSIDNLVYMVY